REHGRVGDERREGGRDRHPDRPDRVLEQVAAGGLRVVRSLRERIESIPRGRAATGGRRRKPPAVRAAQSHGAGRRPTAPATAVFAALLKPGDEAAAAADMYGGTFRLLDKVFKPWGLAARYTEASTPEGFASIITPKTKLVWIETPTNPLLQVLDIAALADL